MKLGMTLLMKVIRKKSNSIFGLSVNKFLIRQGRLQLKLHLMKESKNLNGHFEK